MSTKSIFTFQIIAGVLLLSLLVFGCSGSDSEKTPIPLEGLWAITDTLTITMPEEEEPAVEEPTEEDSAEGEETTEGEEGTPQGAAPLKNGENEQTGETEESTRELEDGTYLDLKSTTYSYFSRSEGVEQGLSSGSYLRKGSELTFIAASEDTTTAEILLLSATGLKLEITIGEKLQEWTLERIELNNIPEEEEEEDPEDGKSEYVDYEAEFHDPEAPEGSLLNPLGITEEDLNQNLEATLEYPETLGNPPLAESYYFLKTDTAASYRLTITVLEASYDHQLLPQEFMRYVQLWVATRPDSEHFEADSRRIEEGQEDEAFVYEGLKTPSGFLYLRLVSLQEGIRYQLKLEKEEVEQEETEPGEGDSGEV
ncbi:hypothetical protein [Geofilum rhodophaeum]|uniref:hypothetical protein n=1 Tax=Geofilum rhodophaeum TaxID=1965019 RepID=UPI000B521EEA|nr:hypothetical protein [Geofilum rhodophaeum]